MSVARRPALGLAALVFSGLGAVILGACTQDQVTVAVRSLERSGPVSFLCLQPPGTLPGPGVPQTACDSHLADDASTYVIDESGAPKPHLYALVTQTVRGEIAVVDLNAATGSVIDQDPATPGATFLPIGAQPVDIVSTPGSGAAFVAVSEPGRPAIYALPATRVRPSDAYATPTYTSWPACLLPSTPSSMILLADPAVGGEERASCDGEYGEPGPVDDRETALSHGDLSLEGQGRQKLLVTLPDDGGVAVIDAQRLLDRNEGTLGPCPIDDFVPLRVDVPPLGGDPGGGPTGAACVTPPQPEPGAAATYTARPADLAYSEGKLYVSDTGAPAIHVLDAASPCGMSERESLLPSSLAEPARVVTTSRIAVSPRPTSDLKRFLYAVDVADASAMVFDISDDAPTRSPLARPNPERTPWNAADRLQFAGAVKDIVLIARDAAATNPVTGAAASGVACDPNPELTTCSATSMSCDEGTLYRTSAEFDTGAGPQKLRGQFAFLLLSSGLIAIADIEDYDAACRGPYLPTAEAGCATTSDTAIASSGEVSCNVVVPHAPRSASYVVTSDYVGRRSPGLQGYPLLGDVNGTLRAPTDPSAARMRALVGGGAESLVIGGAAVPIGADGLIAESDGPRNAVLMDVSDPRSHIVDQGWSLIYEAPLPATKDRIGDLRLGEAGSADGVYDATTRFCASGVQSRAMVRELLESWGEPEANLDARSLELADRLQITAEFPAEKNAYWDTAGPACSYQECQSLFGLVTTPTLLREIPIEEAYEDHVELGTAAAGSEKVECCFPALVTFEVRPEGQWTVLGDASGFLHHVIADPATGACRNSCDGAVSRQNGRVIQTASGLALESTSPYAFRNPMLELSISAGLCSADECKSRCAEGASLPCDVVTARGDQFRLVTQGAFVPLFVDLRGETTDVQPQTIGFLPATGDVTVTDGSLEGLVLVNPASVAVSRKYF